MIILKVLLGMIVLYIILRVKLLNELYIKQDISL